MTRAPVRSAPPATSLAFPFNVRPLMAMWNALFVHRTPVAERGRYLVDGLGHCGACHTPRNALGAERADAYLAGATVDRWEAPALQGASAAPIAWTGDQLFQYLRRGYADHHGGIAGPMIEIVRNLEVVPDDDLRAMARYLATASQNGDPQAVVARHAATAPRDDATARFFDGACGACHHDGHGPEVFGRNIALDLHTNLHAARPDNVVRVILDGIREPASRETGFMPAFRHALDDRQVADLANWMRARFAPERAAWNVTPAFVSASR